MVDDFGPQGWVYIFRRHAKQARELTKLKALDIYRKAAVGPQVKHFGQLELNARGDYSLSIQNIPQKAAEIRWAVMDGDDRASLECLRTGLRCVGRVTGSEHVAKHFTSLR